MAYTLTQLINEQGVTSIFGRRLKIDRNGFLVGQAGMRSVVEDLTSTVASSILPYGLTRLGCTGSSQNAIHTLQAPVVGATKKIVLISSSTGGQMVRASGSALFYGASVSTIGSTVLHFLGRGANVTLEAVSSLAWQLFGAQTSLVSSDGLLLSFTTST